METIPYGPLSFLIGTWESPGLEGMNRAPDKDRNTENTRFRQRMTFEPIGEVTNHEQVLSVLRYHTKAWEEGRDGPHDPAFHEEVGYFIWDRRAHQVMKSFIVPRGIAVLAGGPADAAARALSMSSTLGSPVYGLSSNPFLHEEFQTVRYDVHFDFIDPDTLSYRETTTIKMKGRADLFDHTESNSLRRMPSR